LTLIKLKHLIVEIKTIDGHNFKSKAVSIETAIEELYSMKQFLQKKDIISITITNPNIRSNLQANEKKVDTKNQLSNVMITHPVKTF